MGRPTLDQIGVLGIYTETPLHCGAESGTGYVDQPIQRERHTGFPVIPGSTLKGVLRDEIKASLTKGGKRAEDVTLRLRSVFGSDDPDDPSPGQVSFGDGILAAFPVRSSGVPFYWVTCPLVLERLYRLLGSSAEIQPPESGTCWGRTAGDVLLEEIRLTRKPLDDFFVDNGPGLPDLLSLLPTSERGFGYTRSILADRLLILADHDFRELTETGTEVLTRIKLTALGTTTTLKKGEHTEIEGADRQGNMFVQEVVPPETLFVSPLRASGNGRDFGEELQNLQVLRIGGDETVGRGVTHLSFVRQEEGNR
jgi:CRISPR-associated protein Cmr4